jgi:hypothetical protein
MFKQGFRLFYVVGFLTTLISECFPYIVFYNVSMSTNITAVTSENKEPAHELTIMEFVLMARNTVDIRMKCGQNHYLMGEFALQSF